MLRAIDTGRPLPEVRSLQDLAAEEVARLIRTGFLMGHREDPGVVNAMKASRARAAKRRRNDFEKAWEDSEWYDRAKEMLHPGLPEPERGPLPQMFYNNMRYMLDDDHGMAKFTAWRGMPNRRPEWLVGFRFPDEISGEVTHQQETDPAFRQFVRQRLGLEYDLMPDQGGVTPKIRLMNMYQLPAAAAAVAVKELHADFLAGQAP